MTKYYVSTEGNDNSNGLTPSTAWKTINKVNQSASIFGAGDEILFRSGDTFYGNLTLQYTISHSKLTISAYGTGNKPKLSGYKIPTSWSNDSSNVWKVDLTNISNFTGNIYNTSANVGFIKVGNEIKGFKKFSKSDLNSQWDFYNDERFLYIYSSINPSSNEIKIAVEGSLISAISNLLVTGLDLVGTGSHGITIATNDVTIINNDIHEVGGSLLYGHVSGTSRYGNGVEIWSGSKNVLVENNNVYDCYDVAFTLQGYLDSLSSGFFGWENIVIRNNTDWNNSQSFEFWSDFKGNDVIAGTGFYNCLVENNYSLNAGRGWGAFARPSTVEASAILLYNMRSSKIDITIRNNTFYNPKFLYYSSNSVIPNGFKSHNNNIFMTEGSLLQSTQNETISDYSSFISRTGLEVGSSFFILSGGNSFSERTNSFITSIGLNIAQFQSLQRTMDIAKEEIEKVKATTKTLKDKCKLKHSTNYTLWSSTPTDFALIFDSEEFDTNNMHSTNANTPHIYIKQSGYYLVRGLVVFAANATGTRTLSLFKNNVRNSEKVEGATSNEMYVEVNDMLYLNKGDFLTLKASQSSGVNLDIIGSKTSFYVTRID